MTDETIQSFGPLFKEYREKRNISVKDAAQGIVSPQFLRQFESGKKGISLENFNRLLISVGIDWRDFADDYTGDRLTKYEVEMTKLQLEDPNMHRNWKKLEERLEPYMNDNPYMKSLVVLIINLIPRVETGNFSGYQKEINQFIHYLSGFETFEHMNMIEFDLYITVMEAFPLKMVQQLANDYFERWKTSADLSDLHNFFHLLLQTIRYYTKRELFVSAQELIDRIRTTPHILKFRLSFEMMELEMEEIYILLLQNDAAAIPKARNLIEIFEGLKRISSLEEKYIERLAMFTTRFHELNHTGIDLYQ